MAPQQSHPGHKTVPACVLLHTAKKLRMRLIQFSFNVCKIERNLERAQEKVTEDKKKQRIFGHCNLLGKLQIKAVTKL